MKKHEWRKSEKAYYLPKDKPTAIKIPSLNYLTIAGEGSPANESFSDYIGALYSIAYAIKMNLKKDSTKPAGYSDYTVYPLEGVWDLNDKAKERYDGTIDKNDFVFTLMIRQPDFVNTEYVMKMISQTVEKKPNRLLNNVKFEAIHDGLCIQMMHHGSYDNEPRSFSIMEEFAETHDLKRTSKAHREIYLSDFRKVSPDKLKTVLRFKVQPK